MNRYVRMHDDAERMCRVEQHSAAPILPSSFVVDLVCSALRDRRFSPIAEDELSNLRCTVSFLHSFEKASNWQDWEIGMHGLITEFRDPDTSEKRNATYLPEIAAAEGWTKQGTIDSLIYKAGFVGHVSNCLREGLTLTRYQSTAHEMTHQEYVAHSAMPVKLISAVDSMSAVAVQA